VGIPWVGKLPDNYKSIKTEDGKYKYSIDGSGKEGTWMGDNNGQTPSSNFAWAEDNNLTPGWVRFESFQALYTSIGIIENGMIGSAVYNNEFMFSQQGIDRNGNKSDYAAEAKKAYESAVEQAYNDAYYNTLKNLGYKIRYKKTFKDYFKNFISLILTAIIICIIAYICWQIPAIRNYLKSLFFFLD
jgi:hypothetical protein